MSQQAKRLRRIGESRAMVRANLSERESREEATKYMRALRVVR